jgi:hypothetical protein
MGRPHAATLSERGYEPRLPPWVAAWEREPCCTGLAERMKLGWELSRPFPRRACSESNRGSKGRSLAGGSAATSAEIVTSRRSPASSLGVEPSAVGIANRSPLPAGARGASLLGVEPRRPGSEPGAWIPHDREDGTSPACRGVVSTCGCARPESNRAIGLRRPTPGSARTSAGRRRRESHASTRVCNPRPPLGAGVPERPEGNAPSMLEWHSSLVTIRLAASERAT